MPLLESSFNKILKEILERLKIFYAKHAKDIVQSFPFFKIILRGLKQKSDYYLALVWLKDIQELKDSCLIKA